jgi:antitoxin component YwqK of YwqJK toxin-antitoxin module
VKQQLFIFCLVTFSFISTGFSQQQQFVYYFDKALNSCKKADAIITGKGYKDEGLFKLDYFVNQTGLLLMSVHYTDSTLNVPQGLFQSYYINGVLEKEGNYDNGLWQGLLQQWNDKGLKTDSIIYDKDIRIRFAKFEYYNKEKIRSSYAFTDSFANTYTQLYFYKKGNLSSEVVFAGQRGLLKSYDSTGTDVKTDSVFSREEIEASFPGGTEGWKDFLKKNLRGDVPSDKGAPNGLYTVVVKFRITKDGTLTDIETETNPGYGIENEAIRIIKKSPDWIPAKQYGRFVNAYRRQPISFMVDNSR